MICQTRCESKYYQCFCVMFWHLSAIFKLSMLVVAFFLFTIAGSRTTRRAFEFGKTHVVRPKGKHQATIVWLHGLGDNGLRYEWHRCYVFYFSFVDHIISFRTVIQFKSKKLREKTQTENTIFVLSTLSNLNASFFCFKYTIRIRKMKLLRENMWSSFWLYS